jgi:hypothetical protein
MDQIISCPKCHQSIDPVDYFCRNCGKKLRAPPLPTDLTAQIFLYLKTLLLPPCGLYWGYQYLRRPDDKSKLIGLIVLVATIIETVLLVQYTIAAVNTATQQINQLNSYGS